MMKSTFFCILLPVLLCSNLYAQSFNDTIAKIDDIFKDYHSDDPGGVLIISRHGREIYHREFGYSNLALAASINNQTMFEAASVSKQFTATAVLLLVRNGLVSLDDDIRKYVPELPDYGDVIRIRHLLTHTSGLKDWRNVTYVTGLPTGYRVYNQGSALELICRQKTLNYRPGAAFSYTNSGFDLLGILVERVTKGSFASFVKDSLLLPAGMTRSKFRGGYTELVKNMATSYTGSSQKYVQAHILDETYGAAGLLTTADDLKKWIEYINHDGAGKDVSRMRVERFVLNNGDTIPYANGGVYVKNHGGGLREISHSGLIGGYRAHSAYFAPAGLSIAYTSNNRNIMTVELNAKILEIFFGKKQKIYSSGVTLLPDDLKNKTGTYLGVTEDFDYIQFRAEKNQLINSSAKLNALSANEFEYEKVHYRFSPAGDSLFVTRGEDIFIYVKGSDYLPVAKDLASFAGNYYSEDCDVTLDIRLRNEKLVAFRTSYDSIILVPAFRKGDVAAFRGFDHGLRAMYLFNVPKSGKVNDFRITLPRAANIPFKRKK